jgi:3-hydroxyisobutyrate dehydrogenase-like beta-hydroxyacid dehydrogenase
MCRPRLLGPVLRLADSYFYDSLFLEAQLLVYPRRNGNFMRVLWIGLGHFGRPMAENILDRGQALSLQRSAHARAATDDLLTRGAAIFRTGDVVDICGICVPTPADVEDALASITVSECPLVVDFSTGHPEASRRIARILAQRGIQYIDAPVSGSPEAARVGDLTVWVGSEPNCLVDDATKLLAIIASHIYHMGDVGAGAAMKLTNQIVHISTMASIGEGLAFARSQGLSLEVAVQSMLTSSAESAMLRRFGPSIARGDFATRFALRLALKDICFAEHEAQLKSLQLPNLSALRRILEKLADQGLGETDFSVLADPNRTLGSDGT